MTATIDVIKGALQKLGAHSVPLNPAPPETLEQGVTVLASLIREWQGEEFNVGAKVPASQTLDLNEFAGAREALEYGLMFKMAAEIKKDPSSSAVTEGRSVLRKARERWQYITPDVVKTKTPGSSRRWR